jgi:hypothetical protein
MKNIYIKIFIFLVLISAQTSSAKIISAEKFMDDYMKNSAKADKKYLNKKVDIKGYVNKIRTTSFLSTYIEMVGYKDNYDKYFINAFPADKYKKKVAQLKKGQRIRIIGICRGKTLIGNVKIEKCKVLRKKKKK